MKTYFLFFSFAIGFFLSACGQVNRSQNQKEQTINMPINNDTIKVEKTEEEWRKLLTAEQYAILREKGTERPYSGKLYKVNDQGLYTCAACGNELFTSDMKFDAHCGWPSFDKEMEGGKIKTQVDKSHGMIRTEIMCARCDSHLGHLFDDGPTSTGMRYCVNSLSLNFIKKE